MKLKSMTLIGMTLLCATHMCIAAFPSATYSKTLTFANLRTDNDYADFRAGITGFEDKDFTFTYDQSIAGYYGMVKIKQSGGTNVYYVLNTDEVGVSGSNMTFTISHTNLIPNGTHNFDLLIMDSATTNLVRSAGQGKLVVRDSLFDDDDGTWVNPTATFATDYLLKTVAATTYQPLDAQLTVLATPTTWSLITANATTYAYLAHGASGKVLTSGGAAAAPTWETPNTGGEVYLASNQTFTATNTFTKPILGTATNATAVSGTVGATVVSGAAAGATAVQTEVDPTLTDNNAVTIGDGSGLVFLTFDGSTDDGMITYNPTTDVFSWGDSSLSGIGTLTATSFAGDGSGLTGIPSPWSGAQGAETTHTGDVTVTSGQMEVTAASYPVVRGVRTTGGTSSLNAGMDFLLKTSGDMVDGFGGGITLSMQDVSQGPNIASAIYAFRDGNDTSGGLILRTRDTASWVEAVTVKANGDTGIGTNAPAAKAHIAGDVMIDDCLHLVPVTDPSVTNTGTIFYDSDDNKVKVWTGAAWENLN